MRSFLTSLSLVLSIFASSQAAVIPVQDGDLVLLPNTDVPLNVTDLGRWPVKPTHVAPLLHHPHTQVRIRAHRTNPSVISPDTTRQISMQVEDRFRGIPVTSTAIVRTGKMDLHWRSVILDVQSAHDGTHGFEFLTEGLVKDTFETVLHEIYQHPEECGVDCEFMVFDVRPEFGRNGKLLCEGGLIDHRRVPNPPAEPAGTPTPAASTQ